MAEEASLFDFIGEVKVNDGILEQVKRYQADSEKAGGLILQVQACALLEISNQRMSQLVQEGRFTQYEHFGKRLLGAEEVIAFSKIKRSRGGHKNSPAKQLQKDAWKATKQEMKSAIKKS